jgi:hypothetical protein
MPLRGGMPEPGSFFAGGFFAAPAVAEVAAGVEVDVDVEVDGDGDGDGDTEGDIDVATSIAGTAPTFPVFHGIGSTCSG